MKHAYDLPPEETLDTAPDGLVVMDANHPDYFLALANAQAGSLRIVGQHYDDYGTKVLTLDMGEQGMGRANPSITIGHEFFITALKDYSDWKEKWWREGVQNAVDAEATEVMCEIEEQEDGTHRVTCADNGRGMSQDVLLNKFLVLGGTTKIGVAGAAGGFGKAKELLVLPWVSWSVYSRDTLVNGKGISYEVEEAPTRKGTALTVVMPADNHTTAAAAMSFISKCYLPKIKFTVVHIAANGERTEWTPKAALKVSDKDLLESVEGAVSVYHVDNDSKTYNLYVRAKGIFMFDIWINDIPGYLVAEITAPSIDILMANRDGFRDQSVRRSVSELGNRLAKDTMSALKRKKGAVREVFKGTGKFVAREREGRLLAAMPNYGSDTKEKMADEEVESVLQVLNESESAKDSLLSATTSAAVVKTILTETSFKGHDHVEAALKQLAWEPDFFLINEVDGFKVPRKYWPATMTPTVLRLAKVWTELCRFVLIQLGSSRPFGVGFIFSRNAAACHLAEDDQSWLMLNPLHQAKREFVSFDTNAKIWVPTDTAHLKWLYAAAIHECTHMADGIDYHDESFAAALTFNMAHCADGFRAAKKIVAGIKLRGASGPEADE